MACSLFDLLFFFLFLNLFKQITQLCFTSFNGRNKGIIEKSRGGRFLWKIFEIWAGFGPVDNHEKKMRRLWAIFFFSVKTFLKYIATFVFALKRCRKWKQVKCSLNHGTFYMAMKHIQLYLALLEILLSATYVHIMTLGRKRPPNGLQMI